MHCSSTSCVAGITMARTPSATLRPFKISAAMRISSMRPFVHEPITAWSIFTLANSVTGLVFSGRWGAATVEGTVERSMSITRSYSASSPAANTTGSCCARPFMYSIVFSSTGKMPFFAPASMAMFAMLKRSSIESDAMPSPWNSML